MTKTPTQAGGTFRLIGEPGQTHARTEYQAPDGRTYSASGQGDQVRAMLIEHVTTVEHIQGQGE